MLRQINNFMKDFGNVQRWLCLSIFDILKQWYRLNINVLKRRGRPYPTNGETLVSYEEWQARQKNGYYEEQEKKLGIHKSQVSEMKRRQEESIRLWKEKNE